MTPRRRSALAAVVLLLSTLGSLTFVELTLRMLARQADAVDYGDLFDGTVRAGGQLRPDFDGQVSDGQGGLVRWKTNAVGFRNEREFSRTRSDAGLRILSLGDSFAAGYRVDQEATWARRLERSLSDSLGSPHGVDVMVGVVADPVTALAYLRDHGVAFDPDLVLLSITLGNDIAQAYIGRHPTRIGFNAGLDALRLPDSAVEPARGLSRMRLRSTRWLRRTAIYQRLFDPPGITSWYGRFDKRMLFDPANGLGMYLRDPPAEIRDAYARLFSVLVDFAAVTRAHGIGFAVLVVPQRFQVQPADWRAAVRDYELQESAFDLALPSRMLERFAARESLRLIDPTEFMRALHASTGESLYQPRRDMHWNAAGQSAFFDAIRKEVEAAAVEGLAPGA